MELPHDAVRRPSRDRSASMKTVKILGGGLAGLALGRALARRGVPVVLEEAGTYPRHRVCGEFIAGLDPDTEAALGLQDALGEALPLEHVTWFEATGPAFRSKLPRPARGLSRHTLDARLAADIVEAGGIVREGTRAEPPPPEQEGVVVATGRQPGPPDWIGLKWHALGLEIDGDLEMHAGDGAYCGLARLPGGRVNVCGLFRARADVRAPREQLLAAHLEAAGLAALARRLRRTEADPASHRAVAALQFASRPVPGPGLRVGDAAGMIPPFTGNGMAMAFQSAAAALEPVNAWARGELAWDAACARVQVATRRRFSVRLRTAARLHALVLVPRVRRPVVRLAAAGLLPFRLLFSLTH